MAYPSMGRTTWGPDNVISAAYPLPGLRLTGGSAGRSSLSHASVQRIRGGYSQRAELDAYAAVRQLEEKCRQEEGRVRCISDVLSPQARAALGRAIGWAPVREIWAQTSQYSNNSSGEILCPVHGPVDLQTGRNNGTFPKAPIEEDPKVYVDGIHELIGMLENGTLGRLQLNDGTIQQEVTATLRAYSRGRPLPVHPDSRFSEAMKDVESELEVSSDRELGLRQHLGREKRARHKAKLRRELDHWCGRTRLAQKLLEDMYACRDGRANWSLADLNARHKAENLLTQHRHAADNTSRNGGSCVRTAYAPSPRTGDAHVHRDDEDDEAAPKSEAGPAGLHSARARDRPDDPRRNKAQQADGRRADYAVKGSSVREQRAAGKSKSSARLGRRDHVEVGTLPLGTDPDGEVPVEPDDRERLEIMRARDRWEQQEQAQEQGQGQGQDQERGGSVAAERKRKPGDARESRDLRRRRLEAAGFM